MTTKSSLSSTTTSTSTPANAAVEGLGDLKNSVTAGAHDVAGEVKHLAGDVAGQVRKNAESTINSGKDRAVEGLGGIAHALRHTGEQLKNDNIGISPYVGQAADQVDRVSEYLKNRTLQQMVTDAQDFGRREPALLLGSAFVLGLVGGRFLKAASPRPQTLAPRFDTPSRDTYRSDRGRIGVPRSGYGAGGVYGESSSYGTPGSYGSSSVYGGSSSTTSPAPGGTAAPVASRTAERHEPGSNRMMDEGAQAKPGVEYSADKSQFTDVASRRADVSAPTPAPKPTALPGGTQPSASGSGSSSLANGGSKQLGGQPASSPAPKSSGTAE